MQFDDTHTYTNTHTNTVAYTIVHNNNLAGIRSHSFDRS